MSETTPLHVAILVYKGSDHTLTTVYFLVCRPNPFTKTKMLSVLMSVVPLLTGPNYQHWASSMTSYLMSQGQWASVATECPKEVKRTKVEGEAIIETDVVENVDNINKWIENNTRVVGNMRLCLHHTISFKFQNLTWATKLWNKLKDAYGQPGVMGVYMEFKAALETTIPNNTDPSLALMVVHLVKKIGDNCFSALCYIGQQAV